MTQAIADGFYTKAIGAQMVELEKEQEELAAKVAEEEYERPVFTKEQIVKWMTSFRDKDPSKPKTRKQIIDIFVNAIYLYDDHFTITYNTSRMQDTVPLSAVEAAETAASGSSLSYFGPPKIPNAKAFGIFTYSLFTLHYSLFTHPHIRDFWKVRSNSEK